MWRSRLVWIAFVSVALMLSGGCSLLFVQGPPANHASLPTVDCSYRNTAPVVDSVLAGLAVLDLAVAAGSSDQQWEDLNFGPSRSTVIALALVRLAVYGGSAIYGYSKTSSCREAREDARNRQVLPGVAPVAPVVPAPAAPAPTAPAPAAPAPAAPAPAAPAPVAPAPAAPAPTALRRHAPRIDSLAMRTAASGR